MKCPICGNQAKRVKKDYKYIESGLDNVILSGINVFECDCGEEMPEIQNIQAIHKQIALEIIMKPAFLNGKELRFIRKQMGFKEKEIAELLGVTHVSVSRWERSSAKIGVSNDRLIRIIYLQTMEEESNQVYNGILTSFKLIKETSKHTTIKIPHSVISKYKTQPIPSIYDAAPAASTRSISYHDFFIRTVKKEITALVEKSVAKEKETQDLVAKDRCALFTGHLNSATLLTH
jgi:putative zinc finger/helix-turn-helix YgiT family protein